MIFPGKAGKAHKSCPHCYKLVSRNVVTCPGCSAPCSKKRSVFATTYDSVIIIPAFSLIVCACMWRRYVLLIVLGILEFCGM